MGVEGLKIMAEIRDRFGLRIVTEAIDGETLDQVEQYADVIQIGARNMQNFSLLKRAGRARKPILPFLVALTRSPHCPDTAPPPPST